MTLACFALSVLVVAQQTEKPDLRYMQPARYHALSAKPDGQAPGGFGEGGQKPARMSSSRPWKGGLAIRLTRTPSGAFRLDVMNGSEGDVWLPASDSNLQIYLEAKNRKGDWAPIEYHHWSWCGNSRHRVMLPQQHAWDFRAPVPFGPLRTQVRARMKAEADVVSNEVTAEIPAERFSLAPRPRSFIWDGRCPRSSRKR
jgi:hypothetical protein